MPKRIAILEDHRSFSEALSMALNATAEFECVGAAATAEALKPILQKHSPDVVILDYQLIGPDGIAGARILRAGGFTGGFLMLTAHASSDLARRARAAGIDAVLAKEARLDEVLLALHRVSTGGTAGLEPESAEAVSLSTRQREVLALMGDGLHPREIAKELYISIHTARGHVKDVMRQMKATTQLEAVTNAVKSGYLVIPRQVG